MVTQTQTNLEALVRAYVDVETLYYQYCQRRRNFAYEQPMAPSSFNSLEEADKFHSLLADYEGELEALNKKKAECIEQQSALGKQILDILKVKNAWVRAGDYAVGFYYDVWGGGHYDLAVRKWTDNLPALPDKTYYP